MKTIEGLRRSYSSRGVQINQRLDDFRQILNDSEERIFQELAFCLCTPQSKATTCWNAVTKLTDSRLLFTGKKEQIKPFLNAIRFNENKSSYIIAARELFSQDGRTKIKEKIQSMPDPVELRDWLAENVKGLGMKEASHFIRNIGLSANKVAILDRHILKNLVEYGVISEIPKSLTEKAYLEIEQKMKDFASQIEIKLDEMDLLFWSEETGMIFK